MSRRQGKSKRVSAKTTQSIKDHREKDSENSRWQELDAAFDPTNQDELIAASILAARKLSQYDGGRNVPATVSAVDDAIRWAERIMQEIDRRWPEESRSREPRIGNERPNSRNQEYR